MAFFQKKILYLHKSCSILPNLVIEILAYHNTDLGQKQIYAFMLVTYKECI